MMKFFRKIRYNLIGEGKTWKYIKYAIGEIGLVVIGILIALQINNWNQERLNRIKENDYLSEIKENLMVDKLKIQGTLEFNNKKIATIDSVFTLFGNASNSDDYMTKLVMHMQYLALYDLFTSVRISFDNMISSTKIDIIQNKELRKQLTAYYSTLGIDNSTQEGVMNNTRKFGTNIVPKIIGNKIVQQFGNFNIDFNDHYVINIHKDRTIIADLLIMKNSTSFQSVELEDIDEQIDDIIELIDQEL